MAAKWSEVESSEKYRALPDAEKSKVKDLYWRNVVTASPQYGTLPSQEKEKLRSQFYGSQTLGERAIELAKSAGSLAMKAVTPIEAIHKPLNAIAQKVEMAQESVKDNPAFSVAKKILMAPVGPYAEQLSRPGGLLSPTGMVSAVSPTPLDVGTLGLGAMAKALRAAGLVGRASLALEAGVKAAEKVPDFVPVKTMDEAIVRLEAAAAKAPKAPSILLPSETGPIPKEIIGTNLSRINTTEDVKRLMVDMSSANRTTIDEARRGTQSLSETTRLANEMGMTHEELLKRRKGQNFNAEEGLAARQLLVQSTEDLQKSAQAVASGGGSIEDFTRKMLVAKDVLVQNGAIAAEQARALGARRIMAGGDYNKAVKMILEQSGKDSMEDLALAISKLDPTDSRAMSKVVRDVVEGTTGGKIYEVIINSLLSSPTTHIVNTVGNTLTLMTRPLLEKPIRAAIDTAMSVLPGRERSRFIGEAGADIFGIMRGIPEGVRAAMHTFGDELSEFGASKIEEVGRIAPQIKGPIGKVIRTPVRLLASADEFFKSIARAGEVNSLAYRSAVEKGLKGQARADHIAAILTKDSPESEKIWKLASDEAKYRTYTQPVGKIGRAMNTIRMNTPGARLIVPFLNTPINVTKFGLERTPLNFARLVYKEGLPKLLKDPAMVDELAKPALGSLMMAPVMALAGDGRITGGGPRDPAVRATLRASGWQPYSIKVGDKYYSYGRIEPLGMILGLAADMTEIWDTLDQEDAVSKVALSVAQNVTNKTFMKNFSDTLNAVSDPERYGGNWSQRMAAMAIPSGLGGLTRAMDGQLRRPLTPGESVKSRVPGLASEVAPLRDIWGEPVLLPGNFANRFVNPVYVSEMSKDKATQEMARLKIGIQSPRSNVAGVKLTPQEVDTYIQQSRKFARNLAVSYVSSPNWDGLNDNIKEDMLRKAFAEGGKLAGASLGIPLEQGAQKVEKYK